MQLINNIPIRISHAIDTVHRLIKCSIIRNYSDKNEDPCFPTVWPSAVNNHNESKTSHQFNTDEICNSGDSASVG